MKAITAQQAQRIDQAAQKAFGIPSLILMENAGRCVAETVCARISGKKRTVISVVCGKGNNGGDGFVCARYLFNAGIPVAVYVVGAGQALKRDPGINLNILTKMDIPVTFLPDKKQLKKTLKKWRREVFVDALFGIGFSGAVEGIAYNLIDAINARAHTTIAVDLPSGLNATTGVVENICVKADVTVTFGLPKKGLYLNKGPSYAGEIIIDDVGFPKSLLR